MSTEHELVEEFLELLRLFSVEGFVFDELEDEEGNFENARPSCI